MPSRAILLLGVVFVATVALADETGSLRGTKPLTAEGDLSVRMVAGIHRFLDRQTEQSVEKRQRFWRPDFSSAEAYERSVEPNRKRLRKYLGAVDERVDVVEMEFVATTAMPAKVAEAIAPHHAASHSNPPPPRWAACAPGGKRRGEGTLVAAPPLCAEATVK